MRNLTENTTKVAVLDSSYLEATGIARILQNADFAVETEHFLDTQVLLSRSKEDRFHVLLIDTNSLNGELEDFSRLVKARLPQTYVVWLAPQNDQLLAFDSINAHADGCISKLDFSGIINAVEGAADGRILFSKELLLDFSRRASVLFSKSGRQLAVLTPRERQVLELLRMGAKNREIGVELFISIETVKIHVKNIRKKLGVTSRRQLLDGIPSRVLDNENRSATRLV